MASRRYQVWVCRGPECAGRRDADEVYARLAELVDRRGLGDQVVVLRQNCFGRCSRGPNVYVRAVQGGGPTPLWQLPEEKTSRGQPTDPAAYVKSTLYHRVAPVDVVELVEQHLVAGVPAARLVGRPSPNTSETS